MIKSENVLKFGKKLSNEVIERKGNWKKAWLKERLLKEGVEVHFIKVSEETALGDGENCMSHYSLTICSTS